MPTPRPLHLTAVCTLCLATACQPDDLQDDPTGSPDTAAVDTATPTDATMDTRAGAYDTSPREDADGATADVHTSDTPALDTSGPLVISQDDFECIKNWTKKRRFYITNTLGNLDQTLAVADSPDGGRYPAGTLIQLVPSEAMFKHRDGWAPETNNWEFFSLRPSEDGTEILDRGTTDVENQFGGNCLECHSKAEPKWDFVCEQDHGCDPLPLNARTIESIQDDDPRCD